MSQESNASGFPLVGQYDLPSASLLARVAGEWNNVPGGIVQGIVKEVADKTANYTVLVSESGTYFTNRGASGAITFTLPAAVIGLHYVFRVVATQELRVDPNGSETIENTASPRVGQAGGAYLWANAKGEFLEVICQETGKWSVHNFSGTWTVV